MEFPPRTHPDPERRRVHNARMSVMPVARRSPDTGRRWDGRGVNPNQNCSLLHRAYSHAFVVLALATPFIAWAAVHLSATLAADAFTESCARWA